ncbi:MAG: hypothetical protein QOC57_1004 [Ilumatobacteraceae bacterium]|jgi:hypothetical protein|nr:hypothetical protein [Ilumatobacteraceae bacterium]
MIAARRFVIAVIVLATMVGVVVMQRSRPVHSAQAEFSRLGLPTMPFVPKGQFVTSAWFCAGVPVGKAQLGGSAIVVNPGEVALSGKITVFTDAAGVAAAGAPFEVPARATKAFDLSQLQPQGSFVSAMIEIYGGGGFVEQRADSASGSAVSSCSNSTAATWYFADGYTVDGSREQLVITNPFPSDAIVNISESTATESRRPAILQSLLVKAESVLVISQDLLAKRELELAITVSTSRGRVVVGRAQEYLASVGRAGFTMTLGAPSLGQQFYFADGEVAPNVIERYSIYNGSQTDAVVNVAFLGLDESAAFVNPEPIVVPAGKVASLVAGDVGVPAGRHGAVFTTETAGSIVVERAITRTTADTVATTVVMGSPASFASTRWSMAIGTDLAVDNILVVLNATGSDATVTVKTLGAGGEVPVPGMDAIALPAGRVITIGVSDQTALGHPLVVESTQRIFVERLLPRNPNLRGRSGSFALPG